MTGKEALRHAFVSIAIGTAISLLTILFQFVVEWLQGIQPEVPGVVAGIGNYLNKWRLSQLG